MYLVTNLKLGGKRGQDGEEGDLAGRAGVRTKDKPDQRGL